MTSRQYGVLMRMGHDEREQAKFDQEDDLRARRDSKDAIRNAEELLESVRRDQVERGAWDEAESHRKL